MTACVTPSALKKAIKRPSCPTLIHSTRDATRSIGGSVSSLIAATTMSTPVRRAPSSTMNGKRPLPAMRPYLIVASCELRVARSEGQSSVSSLSPSELATRNSQLFHHSALCRLDERDKVRDVRVVREALVRTDRLKGLG